MKSNSTAFLIKIKLRHSLGRPSRSDFVQSELFELDNWTYHYSCEIKCVALVRMIYRDMRWNRNNTYRLEGKSVPRQQLVSFDLDIPFLVENGKALDENPSPTKPLCGEELSAAESSSASPIKRDSGAL